MSAVDGAPPRLIVGVATWPCCPAPIMWGRGIFGAAQLP